MADFMTLKAKLSLDSSEYDSGLDKAEKKGSGFGKKLAGGAKAVAKGFAVMGTVAVGAVSVLTKKAVDSYAEYEQLAGGVKKLYGDAADEMMRYAEQGYKTAGMSANKYMELATSFSAALINSLDGDASAAAKQTDVAMRAISDNFNTFGGDISMIQGAFQGFAKQNYTMLDNLKLGYGGTKQEMERLISDANDYAKSLGMASDLSIDSFADIVTAIDLVQQKQGIAGTTAKEAATTIEGSLNMTKAAWENLVSSFANPDADIGKLMDNLVVAIVGENEGEGLLNQIIPAIQRALDGIGQLLEKSMPILARELPNLIGSMLPSLISAAMSLVGGLVSALPSMAKLIVAQVPIIIQTIVSAVKSALPMFTDILSSLTDVIDSGMEGFISKGLDMVLGLSEMLRSAAGMLVDAGLDLIIHLAQGFANSMPVLIQKVPEIVTNIAGIINDNAPKVLAAGVKIIVTLAKGLIQAVPTLLANLPAIITAIWNAFTAFNWISLGSSVITAIGNGIKSVGESLPTMLKDLATEALEAFKGIDWSSVGSFVINLIASSIRALAGLPGQALRAIASKGMQLFTGVAWGNVGRSVMQKIGQGITAAASLAISAVKSLISRIKGYFPFNVGKIFSGWVPRIKLTTSKSGDSASTNAHSAGSVKFAKAMTKPYMFKRPTEFYAGEAGDEMLLGRTALRHDLKQAVSEANTGGGDVFNIYLNYNAGADANDMLKDIARGVKRYKMAGVI